MLIQKKSWQQFIFINSENIVIENLEITNWDETAVPGSGWTYGHRAASCYPDWLCENKDAGALSNVVVRNNKDP